MKNRWFGYDGQSTPWWRDLGGWLRDAPGRTQEILVGVIVDRGLIEWPLIRVNRVKGYLRVDIGPFIIEFGG